MITIAIIFLALSFFTSIIVLAAGMLSSRMGQSQQMVEEYAAAVQQSGRKLTPHTYAVEVRA